MQPYLTTENIAVWTSYNFVYSLMSLLFKKKLSRDFIADLHSAKWRNISWELVESMITWAPKTRNNHNFFSIELKFIDVIRCYPTWSCSVLIPTFNFILWLFSTNVPYLLLFQSAMLCHPFISLQPTHMLSSPSLLEYGFSIQIEQVWWQDAALS